MDKDIYFLDKHIHDILKEKENIAKYIEENRKRFEKEDREALSELFKEDIKVSFMFKVLKHIKKITNDYSSILKYYIGNRKEDTLKTLLGPENIALDLCNHIVGVHSFNMLFLNEYERGIKQNSLQYIEELSNTVLDQVKIRCYGSFIFRKRKVFGRDNYLYYPPIYNLHVLLIYLIFIANEMEMEQYVNEKTFILNKFIHKILNKSKAIFSVIDYDALDSGYSILRNIIENYLTFICLKYSSINMEEYLKFMDYKIQYDAEFKLPEEFDKLYYQKGKEVNKIAYLNYGWLDSIFEYEYVSNKKSYNFSDVVKLADSLMHNKRGSLISFTGELEMYYKKCHFHSHSNIYGTEYPILYVMDLCIGLTEVLLGMEAELRDFQKIELIEGIDIVKSVISSVKVFRKMRRELDIEKLEIYYRDKYKK